MIVVIDYGINNSSSVVRMIQKVGGNVRLGTKPHDLLEASKIVLPGVGHFDEGMKLLNESGFTESIKECVINKKIPVLGICLGMQLLCECSEEGTQKGICLIKAKVLHLNDSSRNELKIPHMGWNTVDIVRSNPILEESPEEQRFYFVHSYYVQPNVSELCIAKTSYGSDFCSAFNSDNIFGVQFHPEKSHRFGISLMKRFVEL
mgnify:FL=1